MADETPVARAAGDARLLILIARTEESFDPLVTALLDAGITGATVRYLSQLPRERRPIGVTLPADTVLGLEP